MDEIYLFSNIFNFTKIENKKKQKFIYKFIEKSNISFDKFKFIKKSLLCKYNCIHTIKNIILKDQKDCFKKNKYTYICSKYGHIKLLKFFVENNICLLNKKVARLSCKYNNLNIVKYIFSKQKKLFNNNALIDACKKGEYHIVNYLLK